MSMIGSILETVEARVQELLRAVTGRDDEQDRRLDELTGRVDALEGILAAGQRQTARKTAAKPPA